MRKRINWKKIWDDFDMWLDELTDCPGCKTCGNSEHRFPKWEVQQEKIKELVNSQMKEVVL